MLTAKDNLEWAGTHISFLPCYQPPDRKTRVWQVTERNDSVLGYVRWFTHWRAYAFYPGRDTIYEKVCLREIAEFCENRTIDHREARKHAS